MTLSLIKLLPLKFDGADAIAGSVMSTDQLHGDAFTSRRIAADFYAAAADVTACPAPTSRRRQEAKGRSALRVMMLGQARCLLEALRHINTAIAGAWQHVFADGSLPSR